MNEPEPNAADAIGPAMMHEAAARVHPRRRGGAGQRHCCP
jgi:hypothetical protein